MSLIETFELSKSYGSCIALDQVNLVIPPASIYAVVGPAGSGKTTLLRILATLTTPTGGDATVAGLSVTGSPGRVRWVVGYMPASFGIYSDMTVAEYLTFFAECHGIPPTEQPSLVGNLLQLVDLSHRRNDQLERLTHGMRQRLGLARTLAHDPQVLLLDEPITGIDPRAHVEMRELIKELRNMGKTIVLTSPVAADVDGLCTHLALLDHGQIVTSGIYSTLKPLLRHQRTIVVKFFGNADLATRIVANVEGVLDVRVLSGVEAGSMNEPSSMEAASDSPPAVITVLKQLNVRYCGSFGSASEMLRMLMRSGVQVVSFSEQSDPARELLVQPIADAEVSSQG